ncbi:MAG: helix-turn-helix domain-containing protein [Deltaproteobacteria bacterium]|nr:helix-turn-helix domain-containing protein [Deltaproteobacteria bacterium]
MSMGSYHEQDYYKLLEITPDATREEIEAAYERLKSVFEESSSATFMLFGGDEAASMRNMLEEAYQTLSDERLRERYDDSIGVKRERRESSSSAVAMAHATSVTSTTTPIVDARIVEREPVETKAPETRPESKPEPKPIEAKPPEPVVEAAPPAPPPAAEPSIEAAPPTPEAPSMVVSGPQALDANMEFSGGVLMRLRESKGISLEQIAQRTKISMTHLRAIEANQYDKLPARVYVRGFVSQYARFLSLPQDRVCESYLQIYDRFVQAKTI